MGDSDVRRWARISVALDDATKPLREDFEWLAGEYSRLREDFAAAHDVIRRLRDGWEPMPFVGDEVRWCREGPTEDRPDLLRSWEPMTDAERMLLDAVAGPDDTEENPDGQ